MVSKSDLMKLTGNYDNVDIALPEPWLQKLTELGLDRRETLYSYAYSYKDNSLGKPINLPLEFIKKMENTKIQLKWPHCEDMIEISIMDIAISLLENQGNLEIKMRG